VVLPQRRSFDRHPRAQAHHALRHVAPCQTMYRLGLRKNDVSRRVWIEG